MCLEGRDKVIYKDNRHKWETKKENLKRKNW